MPESRSESRNPWRMVSAFGVATSRSGPRYGEGIGKVAKKWPSGFGQKKANKCKSLAKMAARVGIEPTTK
jgi:hypothetical protein